MRGSYHALKRTSPKGEGEVFIGVCIRCGKEGLTFNDIVHPTCDAALDVSMDDAIERLIEGEVDAAFGSDDPLAPRL